MTVRRALALVVLTAVGWLLAEVPGAALAAVLVVAATRLPGVPFAASAALLVAAAVATVVEEPLSGGKGAVTDFATARDVAASLGRLAGVALVVAFALVAGRAAATRRHPIPPDRRRPDLQAVLTRNAPGLVLAAAAAAVVLVLVP